MRSLTLVIVIAAAASAEHACARRELQLPASRMAPHLQRTPLLALRGGKRGEALLSKAKIKRSALPADISAALDAGKLSLPQLETYLALLRNPFLKLLTMFGPFVRNRLIANPKLATVIAIETALGIFTMLIAEANARAGNMLKEMDFVICDLALVVATNVALVVTLSPAIKTGPPPSGLAKKLGALPPSFMQLDASASQRLGAFALNAAKFGLIGIASSTIGATATKLLVVARERITSERPDVVLAPILSTALAYGAFVALSSSTRYQLVNALEAEVYPRLPLKPQLLPALSAVVRTLNNFLGGMSWIWWARFLGVQ